jgi:hypothetical protein
MFELPTITSSGVGPTTPVGQFAIPVAAVALAVALICLKRALAPLGPVVRVIAAVATMAFALGLAFALLIATVIQGS